MKKTLLSIFIPLLFQNAFSQDPEKKKYDFAFSPGVILQGNGWFGEANVLIGKVVIEKAVVGMSGLRLGAETNFKNGADFTIAPKIGIEASATIVSMRISAVNYFQDGSSELWLVPEIGISYGGFANLTYGYGSKSTTATSWT